MHDELRLEKIFKTALFAAGERTAAFIVHLKVALDHQNLEFKNSLINRDVPYFLCKESFGSVKGYFYVSNYYFKFCFER